MKVFRFFAALILVFATNGCGNNNSTGGSNENDLLVVTSITPAANSVVDSADVLTCEFSWSLNVLEFYADVYFVRFVFEGHTAGDFNYPDSLVFTDMYDIKNVEGNNQLQFPLSKIWHDPEIEHPLDVRIELVKKISASNIVLLDYTGVIHYKE